MLPDEQLQLSNQLDNRRKAAARIAPIDDHGTVDPWVRPPRRRRLRVRLNNPNDWASISGPGAGAFIVAAGGKCMYSAAQKAWMTNRRIASNVLALAEEAGYDIDYAEDGVS